MRRLRQLFLAFGLAAALALGQYAALLHGLGHATEQLSQKPGTPAKVACDQCFTCAQLSSGAPSVPLLLAAPTGDSVHASSDASCAPSATRVVFHSRGPPVLS
jgi:hypothetical protein